MTVQRKKRIVLTGGGTAGHVTPNIALLPALREAGYEIAYVGSEKGIERELMRDCGVRYVGIPTGKLRRYFDLKNFTDPFRVLLGYRKARAFLKAWKPDVVFSKGGFVSVPVVRAAGSLKIPCAIHESDMTPGLANRLCFGAAAKVCCNFPETLDRVPKGKGVLTGTPIRTELLAGSREEGLRFCGFLQEGEAAAGRPILLVMGGSQGAASVNEAVRAHLDELLEDFLVVHLCGAGKYDATKDGTAGYRQFEYVKDELKHLLAAADVVVSRAGANSIFEILALKKPNLLIPLSAGSRGDQILNARSFEAQGFSKVLVESEEEGILDRNLVSTVRELYAEREKYRTAMEAAGQQDAVPAIMEILGNLCAE